MRKIDLRLADRLAVILLIIGIFAPFFASYININSNVLIMLINCYLIAYISYLISFMDTKKVIYMAIPLLVYGGFLLALKAGFKIDGISAMASYGAYIISGLFDVVFVVLVFFLIELILSRLFGAVVTNVLAALSLALYLLMVNTNFMPFDFYYKDTLVYFAFYVMATRIKPANHLNVALYPLAVAVFVIEIIAYIYFRYYPGMYFSIFFLTYIILKDTSNVESINFDRYLAFAYLYPYKLIWVLLDSYVKASPLVVALLATLITYILSQLIYKIRLKPLDYLYAGIH